MAHWGNWRTGLSGLQTVTLASVSNSVSPKEAAVLCPAGKKVIGGGAAIIGGSVASGRRPTWRQQSH